jgi:SAM-dependent methyltransferase
MNNLPTKRRRNTVGGMAQAKARGAMAMPASFLSAPTGRQVPHQGGLAIAAMVDAKPPALCMIHDPWMLDAPRAPVPVFGQYPRGLIAAALPLLRAQRHEILHVCSGTLNEGIRVDVRQDARPTIRADGRALPFRDGSFRAVMLDPPYSPEYAKELYGTDYPLPSHLLAEAARVVRPGGRIVFVHFTVPYPPPGCAFVCVRAISTGCGFMLRALSVFEREQDRLL